MIHVYDNALILSVKPVSQSLSSGASITSLISIIVFKYIDSSTQDVIKSLMIVDRIKELIKVKVSDTIASSCYPL